jgi:hypothetical protein
MAISYLKTGESSFLVLQSDSRTGAELSPF